MSVKQNVQSKGVSGKIFELKLHWTVHLAVKTPLSNICGHHNSKYEYSGHKRMVYQFIQPLDLKHFLSSNKLCDHGLHSGHQLLH